MAGVPTGHGLKKKENGKFIRNNTKHTSSTSDVDNELWNAC
jgi:hypothetical protein